MRFSDVRHVPAPAEDVWTALHDRDVLHMAIPGCERLSPVSAGRPVRPEWPRSVRR